MKVVLVMTLIAVFSYKDPQTTVVEFDNAKACMSALDVYTFNMSQFKNHRGDQIYKVVGSCFDKEMK